MFGEQTHTHTHTQTFAVALRRTGSTITEHLLHAYPLHATNNGTSAACIPTDNNLMPVLNCANICFAHSSEYFGRKFRPKLASHYKPVKYEVYFVDTVRTMFGELSLFVDLWEVQPCLGDPE